MAPEPLRCAFCDLPVLGPDPWHDSCSRDELALIGVEREWDYREQTQEEPTNGR